MTEGIYDVLQVLLVTSHWYHNECFVHISESTSENEGFAAIDKCVLELMHWKVQVLLFAEFSWSIIRESYSVPLSKRW